MLIWLALSCFLCVFIEARKLTPFDLDTSCETFTNHNTDYEQTLYKLWEAHSERINHPLMLNLQKLDKFYGYVHADEENLLHKYNSFDNVSSTILNDIYAELPFLNNNIDNLKKYKENAIYILIRNYELDDICETILNYVNRVVYPYYDFVFLNDKAFDPYFIEKTSHYILNRINKGSERLAKQLIRISYGLINNDIWDPLQNIDEYNPSLDLTRLKENWEQQEKDNVLYGGSRSYRNMCRYQSLGFYKHPLLNDYKYTMRMEPGVKYTCDFDPFLELRENTKYAFTIALLEYENTIPTLFDTYKEYPFLKYKQAELFKFIQGSDDGYNRCHFWTNFEIISLDWVRSVEYNNLMDYLDQKGGFYLERWGDAPLRTLAVVETLNVNEVQWYDIGYFHNPFSSCPGSYEVRKLRKCCCDAWDPENMDKIPNEDAPNYNVPLGLQDFSCLKEWWKFGEGKHFLFKDYDNLFT